MSPARCATWPASNSTVGSSGARLSARPIAVLAVATLPSRIASAAEKYHRNGSAEMVCLACSTFARAVLRSFCASAARARSRSASPRCSAWRPVPASALSRATGLARLVCGDPHVAGRGEQSGLFELVGRSRERRLLERLGGGLGVARPLASSARLADEGLARRSVGAGGGRGCGQRGGEQDDHGAGSTRAATTRTSASIWCGSDRR